MRLFNLRQGECQALAWAGLYIFSLFLAYYVMRPVRDELGVAGGVRHLPWLFTGTLLVMLAINPLFSAAVRRWSRQRFIVVIYRFFIINLLMFMAMMYFSGAQQLVWVGRAFFIWVSVFNLFVVSVFWSFVVDIFQQEQGKRLFGFLAAGATLGGIVGSALTVSLVGLIGQQGLLLIAVILLEVAVMASRGLARQSDTFHSPLQREQNNQALGGGIFSGMTHTFRSPRLLGIAGFMLLYSMTSTFLYFQQAAIAENNFADSASRIAFFAHIDFWVNSLTLALQLFLTGRLIAWLGVAAILCSLPFISLAGFAGLAAWPTFTVFVVFQVARRVSNFGLARPAREVLFTWLPREDRYKAKNFIDTVVYRTGDQVAGWSYTGLAALGLSMTGMSLVAVPLCALWLLLSLWLGRQSLSRSSQQET
ncbi:NTP/NDP exchange transporter [Rouxiella aceris]|nr:MFS transporter [Rouxiella aceris]